MTVLASLTLLAAAGCQSGLPTPTAELPTAIPAATPTALAEDVRTDPCPTPTAQLRPDAAISPSPTVVPPTDSPQPTWTPGPCYGMIGPMAREWFTYEALKACLDTPREVARSAANNLVYEAETENEYLPAHLIWERGADDCDGFAIFQCTILEAKGWDAKMIGLSIESAEGHNVCGVEVPWEGLLVLDNGWIEGPFESLEEMARFYVEKGWMVEGGSLRTLRASAVQTRTTDYTEPSVLDLPWTVHAY